MKKSIILAFLLGAVAIPIILDRVIFSNCIYSNITNGEWASFLGSYIGGVCTLIAVFMTISDNNKKFKEQKDIQQEKEDEEKRLRVRPYLNTGFCDFKQEVNIQNSDRIIEMEAEIPRKMYYNLGNGRRMQIDPALVVCHLTNGYADQSELAAAGNEFFTSNCVDAPASPVSETFTNESGTIYDAKLACITTVVVDGGDVEAAMQTYVDTVGSIVDQCLTELNQ